MEPALEVNETKLVEAITGIDWVHEIVFSGGIKKGGTWGGPVCAAHVDYHTHRFEVGLWIVLSVIVFLAVNIPDLLKTIKKRTDEVMVGYKQPIFWKQVDFLVAAIHMGMWLQVVWYKTNLKSLINLLQPCHLSLLINTAAVLLPGLPGVLCTMVGLPLAIGAVMALAFPATEGLDQPYEVLSFFIQHWILLVVPLYLVSRNNFVVARIFNFRCLLLANWMVMIVHWFFFVVGAVLIFQGFALNLLACLQHLDRRFEVNVNFFLCPSEGMAAPFSLVPWFLMWPGYRTFLSNVMFLCSIPLCYGYVWIANTFRKAVYGDFPDKKRK
jgi:hypothetical protein